ncbi:tRNA modification GTPase [uncultured Lacinutrix sp.]|uniref:tRNA modification GTPase n=1 Tax=uncultured Lacinutrix sp. TaxID=574032 RepID=UPI002611688C|nr:tRNA modification GTPase [uncultured Lacinutrix sp.]
MIKKVLFVFIALISFNCYSQITYEKGYFIDNTNNKIDCLIKDLDWKNNPTEFKYKILQDDDAKTITIKSVVEFGVYNKSKYIRETINIDRSSDYTRKLSIDEDPIFNQEELFLNVLIEGKSNLLEYVEGDLRRYFYTNNNSEIEQLVYKRYISNSPNNDVNPLNYNAGKGDGISENNGFKKQLFGLKCPSITLKNVKNLHYKKKDLVSFFTKYNSCNNNSFTSFSDKKDRDLFNLTLRPRINSSSLTLDNSVTVDFGNATSYGFGLEAELILNFNKNKWSILLEPTYQYFKAKAITESSTFSGGEIHAAVDYKSIEIPFGLRHYMFINDNSKIFINASYIFDLEQKSSIELNRKDGSNHTLLNVISTSDIAVGIGYKQNDKYSIELRYFKGRTLLNDYAFWDSNYKTVSLIIGYSIL